jgi:hypothetical protein
MARKKKLPRLENWSLVGVQDDGFKSPEQLRERFLEGYVYGHPKHPDGHPVTTTAVLHLDIPGRRARTVSREYELGEMEPGFAVYLAHLGNQ